MQGEFSKDNGTPVFEQSHHNSIILGELGSRIKKRFKNKIEIKYIDPRNQLYLIHRLLKEVFIYKPPIFQALKTTLQFFRCPAIIVNGIVVNISYPDKITVIEKMLNDL